MSRSQAQIRRPGFCARFRTGDGGPGEAEIPEARRLGERRTGFGGPQGRSRMEEVAAA